MPTSIRNNRGFTLVELMSAVVITMVGLLGLIQAMNYAAQENFYSSRRDEAVHIAEETMADLRSKPYSNGMSLLSTCSGCTGGKYSYPPLIVTTRMRNGKGSYAVYRTTKVSTGQPHADIGVKVRWKYKNISTSHEVHSIRYRDDQ